ncbi:Reticuline oxidase-like protein [Acorus calamus]|uniref:Reticuline oxidase-like protein n=1 Tax=Acorus calamus TaxID=4465 RepID=A0AAV9CWJ3_ACOCL|nr:Reticuline oxidase-like protein [Acorus calamus]
MENNILYCKSELLECIQISPTTIKVIHSMHECTTPSSPTYSLPPFTIVDLSSLRKIDVDARNDFTWVQSGAILGEIYYKVAQARKTHGFPSGLCSMIDIGGHFCGGGFGTMLMEHGVTVDHVDLTSMDEDLFWAI